MPEVRRLLAALRMPPDQRAARVRWSDWRRAHRATAGRCHRGRRARRPPAPSNAPLVAVAVPGTPALTDAAWARIAPLLPVGGRRGKQWRDHRAVLAGILWVMRHGASWRDMPLTFAPWHTAHTRYTRWRRDGTWHAIRAALAPPLVSELQL